MANLEYSKYTSGRLNQQKIERKKKKRKSNEFLGIYHFCLRYVHRHQMASDQLTNKIQINTPPTSGSNPSLRRYNT